MLRARRGYLGSQQFSSSQKEACTYGAVTPHLLLPMPWQPLIYFVSLVCFFWTLHINRMIKYVVCMWLFSLGTLVSRAIHVVTRASPSLLSTAEFHPAGGTDHTCLSLHSRVDICRFTFWLLRIVLLWTNCSVSVPKPCGTLAGERERVISKLALGTQ